MHPGHATPKPYVAEAMQDQRLTAKGGFAPILILVILAVSVIGAVLYQQLTSKTQPQSQSTSSPSPTNETANPDSIGANWKTYTSDKFGFQIKYPDTPYLCGDTLGTPICLTEDNSSEIWIYEQQYGNTEDLLTCGTNYDDCIKEIRGLFITLETEQVKKINGYEGLEFKGVSDTGRRDIEFFGTDQERVFVIENPKKNGIIVISQRVFSQKLDTVFDQILSTFQFLNSQIGQNNSHFCTLFSNSTFSSVDKHEVGLGPNGAEMGYWSIQFREGTFSDYGQSIFEWNHSDFSESGFYSCEDNLLNAKSESGGPISTSYDFNQELLDWDGVKYQRLK